MNEELINQWLELVGRVRGAFKSAKYQEWRFIVGSSSSLEDRIELGKRAFEMLKPKSNEVNVITFNQITNATSPLSSDFPMWRGVIKP